jgi:hypothetical protein
MTTILLAVVLALAAQAKPAALPDTSQGRHVEAWLAAFNSGDEKAFLAAQRTHMARRVLEKRPEGERVKMYQRLRGDFGVMKIEKVVKAGAEQIRFTARTKDGGLGTLTFDFEDQAPFLIVGIGIDVEGPGGGV